MSSEEEVRSALSTSAQIIGINNRDLWTLEIDLSRAHRLAPMIRAARRIPVAMSGISDPGEVKEYMKTCSAVLIGSSIAKAENPQEAMEEFACM